MKLEVCEVVLQILMMLMQKDILDQRSAKKESLYQQCFISNQRKS